MGRKHGIVGGWRAFWLRTWAEKSGSETWLSHVLGCINFDKLNNLSKPQLFTCKMRITVTSS